MSGPFRTNARGYTDMSDPLPTTESFASRMRKLAIEKRKDTHNNVDKAVQSAIREIECDANQGDTSAHFWVETAYKLTSLSAQVDFCERMEAMGFNVKQSKTTRGITVRW